MFSDLLPALWLELLGTSFSAFASHLCRRRILSIIHYVRHSSGRDVDHELAELDWIAGPRGALECHALRLHQSAPS